jgi:formylglycine-generating enzyme required for sulfatase activity
MNVSFRRRIFHALARHMHCRIGGRVRELALPEAATAVHSYFSGDTDEQRQLAATRFLEAEVVASGIVTPRGQNQLQFWHLSLQEMLVADLLKDSPDNKWPSLLSEKRIFDPQWREVVLLLAGRLGNSERAQALLHLIVAPAHKKRSSLTVKACAYGLAMAAVTDLRPYQFVPDQALGLDRLGHEVMRIFTPEGLTVPLKVRIEVAEALGRSGDPRLAKDNWVEIEPGLCFGTYQVTVHEYARFVDDGGYEQNGFGAGWMEQWNAGIDELLRDDRYQFLWKKYESDQERRLPNGWEKQLATPNRPVVNVSWYEADAYCRWLSTQPGEHLYRLPTDEEWERAARGAKHNHLYPWGDDDPGKGGQALANYIQTGIRTPGPVGLFPAGNADWGEAGSLCDMAGNVWEWCTDSLNSSGKSERGGYFRPLRGGSAWDRAENFVVSYQNSGYASLWDESFGFRIVRCRG